MSVVSGEKAAAAKERRRFNLVDVLIVAALSVILLVFLFGAIFRGASGAAVEMTVSLNENDARQMAITEIELSAGSKVFDADTGELLGRLKNEFNVGDRTMVIVLESGRAGSYVKDQQCAVKSGKLICRRATVTGITEVNGDGN